MFTRSYLSSLLNIYLWRLYRIPFIISITSIHVFMENYSGNHIRIFVVLLFPTISLKIFYGSGWYFYNSEIEWTEENIIRETQVDKNNITMSLKVPSRCIGSVNIMLILFGEHVNFLLTPLNIVPIIRIIAIWLIFVFSGVSN